MNILAIQQVAWLDVNSLPMTYEDRRIIDDSRFDLKRQSNNEWNLHLRDLRWDDQGPYRCTVNTSPIRVKLVNLRVKGQPFNLDDITSCSIILKL